MDHTQPEHIRGMMIDNEGSELQPDPDERTNSDMDAIYGNEIRQEEKLNIKLYINRLMKKLDEHIKACFGRPRQ